MSGTENLPLVTSSKRLREMVPVALVSLSFVGLAIRLVYFVHKNAVNILFSDQWDIYGPLFNRLSWWDTFRWQHGPHRQGIGSVLERGLATYSHWNTRWDAFLVVGVIVLSALAALVLKVKLFGKLQYSDVVIPCIFFTLMQYEIFLGPVNPSHAAIPVLMLLLYCLGWLFDKTAFRYGVILVLDFLAIYTGFGVFVGVITPILIGAEVVAALRRNDRSYLLHSALALLVSLLWLVSFFIGYRYLPAVDCVDPAKMNITLYPRYAGLMLMNLFQWKGATVGSMTVGVLLLLLLLSVAVSCLVRVYRGGASNVDRIVVTLVAFTSLFALTAAVGRVCLGLEQAQSSRYIPNVVPAILGFYFYLLKVEERHFRLPLVTVLVAACIHGTFHLPSQDQQTAQWLTEGKRNWKSCYLKTDSVALCDERTSFKIYGGPPAEKTHLKTKLQFLQANRLNLFASDQ